MKLIRRGLIAGGVAAGLAGAYFAGAAANRPVTAEPAVPPPVDTVNGLKIPDVLPPAGAGPVAEIKEPTAVLTGAKPVPAELLRNPPPAAETPQFVVPDLPK